MATTSEGFVKVMKMADSQLLNRVSTAKPLPSLPDSMKPEFLLQLNLFIN